MTWQICKDPIDVTISSLACVTITLLGILRRNTSPTPIGLYSGFLSDGIKRHGRNTSKDDGRFSAVHNFFNYLRKNVA